MNPDQTAPDLREQSDRGSCCLQLKYKQMRKQMTIVVKGEK